MSFLLTLLLKNDMFSSLLRLQKKYTRFFRIYLKSSLNSDASTHSLAMGAAVGAFFGLGPTFGFQLIPALLICFKFKYNKILAVFGVFITNPFTVVPVYIFNLWVGNIFFSYFFFVDLTSFKTHLIHFSWHRLFSLGSDIAIVFIGGSLIVASLVAVLLYFFLYYSISAWRSNRGFI